MASKLIARRKQPKKATTLVSKQSLESAIQEGQALVDVLIQGNAHDERLDQVEQAISFLSSILKKSPVDMQAEGAGSLEDYLDDAVMPEMAAKIKADVDLIVGMKNQTTPNRNVEMTPTMASGSDNWVTNREEEEVKEASGSDNWVSDRVDGKPEEPVLAEVPRLASKNADLFYGKKKAAPVPVAPAAPAKPSADITQLSSDTLAKMQKALAGSEDLMNDKAAQAFIAAIAEELMNRPVEVEQEQPAAPAAGAVAPPAPMPIAASFTALAFAGFEDEEEEIENPECPACGGPGMFLGQLGNLAHFTCRNCGMQFSQDGDGHDSHMAADRRKDFFKDDMKKKREAEEAEKAKTDKTATAQGGSFVNDGETGNIVEDGGRLPEVAKAHAELEDNTGIKRPATELVTKFAADDITTGSALKKVEKAGDDLKALYLETKKVTKTLDSRPVREAIEAIYRAYDMMGEAAKVLNKQKMQEEAEEKAIEVKDKNKGKKSSLFDALTVASEEDEAEEE